MTLEQMLAMVGKMFPNANLKSVFQQAQKIVQGTPDTLQGVSSVATNTAGVASAATSVCVPADVKVSGCAPSTLTAVLVAGAGSVTNVGVGVVKL